MADYLTTDTELTSVANAIRTKGGTSAQLVYPAGFVSAIEGISTGTDVSDTTATAGDVLSGKYFYTSAGTKTQGSIASQAAQTITPTTTDQTIASGKYLTGAQTIKGDANLVAANIAEGVTIFGVEGTHSGGGGGAAASNDVNFYDYDGTILYSYSASDFANLTALPANPSHDGLTAQGWNWTLSDAKTYVASYGKLNVGQMYITTDGKTHIHIHLEQDRTIPMLGCCPNGTVDVDWGDGTTHDTLTGTDTTVVQWTNAHNYAAPGDYVIKLAVTGSMGLYGSSSSNEYCGLLRYSTSADTRNRAYLNAIQRVEIGTGVTSISRHGLSNCYSLSSITIPSSVTSISTSVFSNCYSLTSITIPSSLTSINGNMFQYCYSLSSITIPSSVTSIGTSVFYYCYSLSSITIPSSVTSIGYTTFYNCYSLPSIIIPNGVTKIDNSAFQYCYSLSSITIPSSVTSISYNAFSNCYSLPSIIMPSSLTSIDSSVFSNCYSLTSITIPSSVTSISSSAFQNCYGLGSIHFKRSTPPTVTSSSTFNSIHTDCKIYVPTGSLSAYTSATSYPSSSTYTYIEE